MLPGFDNGTSFPSAITKSNKIETLRSKSMAFVCSNITLVDSFEGFPSEIAKEIFQKCTEIKFKDLTNCNEQRKIIQLFTDAYPDEFLTSCKLNNSLNTVNELDNQIPYLIAGLHSLDLSGCCLGDSHDILPLLKSCKKLTTLSLADNNLTYKGLRAVFGIKRSEDMKLEYIDVCRNWSISHIGISSYVMPISSVQNILVSVNSSNLLEWKDKLKSGNFSIQKTTENPKVISNEGWAACLVERWINLGKLKTNSFCNKILTTSNDRLEKRKRAQTFYSRTVKNQHPISSNVKQSDLNFGYDTYLCKRESNFRTPIKCSAKLRKVSFDDTEEDFLSMINTYK